MKNDKSVLCCGTKMTINLPKNLHGLEKNKKWNMESRFDRGKS